MIFLRIVLRFITKLIRKAASSFRYLISLILYPGIVIGRGVNLHYSSLLKATDGGTITIGDNVSIERNTTIVAKRGCLHIGSNTFVGEGSIIVANSSIRIGSDCLIAAGVTIRDHDHRFDDLFIPIRLQGVSTEPILIGSDVWLGAKVTVLKGVSVGDQSIVGANSVITRNIPPQVIAIGTPARVIRGRSVTPVSSHGA